MRYMGVLAVLGLILAGAGMASGTTVVYTDENAFKALIAPGYYLNDFDYAPWTTLVDPAISTPQSFAGSGWAYQISSPSGLSGQPIPPPNGPGGAVANYTQGQSLTVTFTGNLPKAVGGIFWETDINGNFMSGGTVTITLATGGTSSFTYPDSSNWNAFTGFISDSQISKMTLTAPYFATMDHLYVAGPAGTGAIPEPLTMAGLGMGICGLVGYLRRRRS